MHPSVSYEQVITAVEGQHAVRAWCELAELLEPLGWSFGYSSDGAMVAWTLPGRRVWATAEALRRRPVRFVAWQGGRSADEVTWWNCGSIVELTEVVGALEARRRPPGGTHLVPTSAAVAVG